MSKQPIRYQYHLGGGIYLEAYSIDPNINKRDLAELVSSKDGTAQLTLDSIASVRPTGSVERFNDLEVQLNLEKAYSVPKQLQAYREAVGKRNDAKGWHNGPVAIVDGPLENPLKLFQGGYYDFVATKLQEVPHDLVPDKYPAGKKIAELFEEWGVNPEDRARYLGFAHVMLTEGGERLSLVQRAKGMAIAPDCIALSGSTPYPEFAPGFDFKQYCKEHMGEEMKDEFSLGQDEFQLAGVHLFDDKKLVPFAALEISTPLTTQALAERIYGKKKAIDEHPVIYSVPVEGADILLKRFEIFPSNVNVLRTVINCKI